MRRLLTLIAVALLLALVGCSKQPPNAGGSQPMVISALAKDLGIGSNVTRVTLTVTADDMETITAEAALSEGEAVFTLEVTIGEDRLFTMVAFDEDDVELYRGQRTIDVLGGQINELIIDLEPQVPMIKVTPIYRRVNTIENVFVQVRAYNIDSLFGVSFRLEFDSTLLSIESSEAGDFFEGSDPIYFELLRANYIAVGYTLRGTQQPQGVSGDGSLVELLLTPLAAGNSPLTVSRETLQLVDWRGELLPATGVLYIEDGEVQIDAP